MGQEVGVLQRREESSMVLQSATVMLYENPQTQGLETESI